MYAASLIRAGKIAPGKKESVLTPSLAAREATSKLLRERNANREKLNGNLTKGVMA